MTREEAIIELQRMKKAYCNTHTDAQLKKDSKIIDALDIGIKALEQDHCEDCISRQAVNDLQKYRYNCGDTSIMCVSLNSINELPPVTPQMIASL